MDNSSENKQVKSKKRVADHGEVFTAEREVNAMLDLVKDQTERIEATFLEPACGNGNFLAEVLMRKLLTVEKRHAAIQPAYERNAIVAVSSIYGVDILEDNAAECRERLFKIFDEKYTALYNDRCEDACRSSVRFLLKRNILWGNALDFKNPVTHQPIIFSEWKLINEWEIKRNDYIFEFLVKKSYQTMLFDENNEPKHFDKEIQHFKPTHYLKLADAVANEL